MWSPSMNMHFGGIRFPSWPIAPESGSKLNQILKQNSADFRNLKQFIPAKIICGGYVITEHESEFWRHQTSEPTHSTLTQLQNERSFWSEILPIFAIWSHALFPRVHTGRYVTTEHEHAFWRGWISLVICSAWTWFQVEPNFWNKILLIFAI
jgi:hypothetical protein